VSLLTPQLDVPPEERQRVYLNGLDVSSLSFAADDEEGWVNVYIRDKDGQPVSNAKHDGLLSARLRGLVEFR
jgi:hypothetical protein